MGSVKYRTSFVAGAAFIFYRKKKNQKIKETDQEEMKEERE